MKKFIAVILSLSMIACLAACSKSGSSTDKTSDKSADTSSTNDNVTEAGTSGENKEPAQAVLTGKLNLIELDDRDPSVLRGVRIIGNRVGTQDDINGRESSLTDVRCIFELNEWIEFYPDTDKEFALRVWILKHRDDQEYYNTCKFSDLMPNFASYCDLHYPVDAEKPDESYWGSFYLHPEECEPGYYDFVFTYEGKAIATLLTRFYKEGELSAKSGAELEALMKG